MGTVFSLERGMPGCFDVTQDPPNIKRVRVTLRNAAIQRGQMPPTRQAFDPRRDRCLPCLPTWIGASVVETDAARRSVRQNNAYTNLQDDKQARRCLLR